MAWLVAHTEAPTRAGTTHAFPAHQHHSVGTRGAFSISLVEQSSAGKELPFTTWQRLDIEAKPVLHEAPVPVRRVLDEARVVVEEALFAVAGSG